MGSENRHIKNRESALIRAGKFLCNKFNYQWDIKVSFDMIVDIEEQHRRYKYIRVRC